MFWIVFFGILLVTLAAVKIYNRATLGKCNSYSCLVGKTAIITGANTSIGFVTAMEFAKRGARVILACRNPCLAEEARKRIIEETGNANVETRIVNLASLESVRKFAQDVNKTVDKLHILVNNAGAGALGGKKTEDGLNMVMQINYYGPFLLTNLLIGLLKKSEPSRIVNVGSMTAQFSQLDLNDLNKYPTKLPREMTMYANSKLCDLIFTNELARRLSTTKVTANCLHPGAMNTGIWRRIPSFLLKFVNMVETIFFKTVEEGAETTVHVAVSKKLEGVSGKYFIDCKEAKQYRTVRNAPYAKKLWDNTMDMIHLEKHELQF